MNKISRYNRRRSSVPADRHKRANAARHTAYKKRVIKVNENTFSEIQKQIPEVIEKVEANPVTEVVEHVEIEEKESVTKAEENTLSRREMRRNNRNTARLAEIDAILGREKYSLKDLLFHPYKCMVQEGKQEICTSFLLSLCRSIILWISVSVSIAIQFQNVINAQNMSYIRLNFTQTSSLAMRILVLLVGCELLSYVVNVVFARFTGNFVSVKRLFAISSTRWLYQLIWLVISAIVCVYYPVIGFVLMLCAVIHGLLLSNHAISESVNLSRELQAFIGTGCFMLSFYVIYQWFHFVEEPLVSMLLELFGK